MCGVTVNKSKTFRLYHANRGMLQWHRKLLFIDNFKLLHFNGSENIVFMRVCM